MRQTLTCPSCNSPLISNQKFCGVCGLNLTGSAQQPQNACPTCGSPILQGQQFCQTCGTRVDGIIQKQPAIGQQAAPDPSTHGRATMITSEPGIGKPPAFPLEQEIKDRPHKHRILSVAGVIFQIFGWIILVFGILASIAIVVFTAIGGSFEPTISGLSTLGGISAIGVGIGGIIVSLLYGFGLLAFAEICYTVRDIDENINSIR